MQEKIFRLLRENGYFITKEIETLVEQVVDTISASETDIARLHLKWRRW